MKFGHHFFMTFEKNNDATTKTLANIHENDVTDSQVMEQLSFNMRKIYVSKNPVQKYVLSISRRLKILV